MEILLGIHHSSRSTKVIMKDCYAVGLGTIPDLLELNLINFFEVPNRYMET